MKDASENPNDLPWWLLGDQQCSWCLQEYAVEVEIRCAHCDDAVCPDCIVEISEKKLFLCGPCADALAAESDTDGAGA